MAEDARGADPPSTSVHHALTQENPSGAQDSPAATTTTPAAPPTKNEDISTAQAKNEKNEHDEAPDATAQSRPEEDISLLPPLTDREDNSLFLSSEIGDRERGNNQTLIEEHEMRRKLMDMESSFLPEPSTIDVATTGRVTGADDTYLVGVGNYDPDMTESSIFSFIPPSESYQGTEQDQDGLGEGTENVAGTTQPQHSTNDISMDSFTSSPSAEAMLRSLQREQQAENPAENSLLSQEEQPFRSQLSITESESQLTPSKLRQSSRSLSPGASRIFSDQSGSVGGSRRSASRPKYLTSRQSSQRLSHSSVASNNTETTHSDATLGADFALQSGGAASEQWGGLNAGPHSHMIRTTSLGSMASGVSGYSEENPLERRNIAGPADGGLHTLEEEGSPQSSRQAAFDDVPVTPKAKPRDSIPTDTAIAERVKGIQVPTAFVQRFRDDFGHTGTSPEKRRGTSTPAFGRSGRTMTLKEQSSTIDRLSKENFDLKMRIHFLNEALNKRSEEGIKEMISENVELKSDKLKLQKDNQGLKRKVRDLEKQLKDQQSDKDSMVNHDPEASEDDRESAQDEELIFMRERVETYELEIERMRSENIARESEKRRLAEMVKSLSENRTGGSDAGAREERVCF